MKIGIVGTGWVGASVAISVLQSGIATSLLLHDTNARLAEGEALDLAHGASFYPPAHVTSVPLEAMVDADAVVIAAGRGSKPNESRLDLLRDNAAIVGGIARRLSAMRGIMVVVTNPVDLMTRIALEASGLPANRVIGTGTMLDTARLRRVVADRLQVDPQAVHAQVLGEHGDSEVVGWSAATAGGLLLRHWPGWNRDEEALMAEQVRRAAYEIIARKGATNHAIGLVTATLLRSALRDERRVLTVSRLQEGAFGVRDVALSLPTIVGRDGATTIIAPDLNDTEQVAFARSADTLRQALKSLATTT